MSISTNKNIHPKSKKEKKKKKKEQTILIKQNVSKLISIIERGSSIEQKQKIKVNQLLIS